MRHRPEKTISTVSNTQLAPSQVTAYMKYCTIMHVLLLKHLFKNMLTTLVPPRPHLLSFRLHVTEVWLHLFKANVYFKIMHLRELLGKNILGSLDTMSQDKLEFIGLLSFVLLKNSSNSQEISLKVDSGLEELRLSSSK